MLRTELNNGYLSFASLATRFSVEPVIFLYRTLSRLSDKSRVFWVSIICLELIIIFDIVKSIVANVLQTANTSKHLILEAEMSYFKRLYASIRFFMRISKLLLKSIYEPKHHRKSYSHLSRLYLSIKLCLRPFPSI